MARPIHNSEMRGDGVSGDGARRHAAETLQVMMEARCILGGRAGVPPSPDSTSGAADQADYSSPGEHPAQDKKKTNPDMDNASEAVTQQVRGSELELAHPCKSPGGCCV